MDKYLIKCRLCLKRNGTVSIFSDTDGETLRDIISSLCIEISDKDEMPQNICTICSWSLTKYLTFKLNCQKSDRFLREIFDSTFRDQKYLNSDTANDAFQNVLERELKITKKCPKLRFNKTDTSKKKSVKKSLEFEIAQKNNQIKNEKNLLIEVKNINIETTNLEYSNENSECLSKNTETNLGNIDKNKDCIDNNTSLQPDCKFEGRTHIDVGSCMIEYDDTTTICQQEDNNRVTIEDLYFGGEAVASAPVTVSKKKRRLRKYLCASCGYAANDRCSLRVHQRLHTGEKPFDCPHCDRRFAVKANLNSHISLHSGSRRFICEVCGRAFAAATSLRCHARTHTGARPHTCTTCTSAFASPSNLRAHMRMHTEERPYCCQVCSRAFKSSSELHQHERRHTGVRPHACAQCARSFMLASNLRAHARTHAPADHTCMYCDRIFTCKAALSAHQRVHNERVGGVICEVCGKRFSRKSTLDNHRKKHQNTTIPDNNNQTIATTLTHNEIQQIEGNVLQLTSSSKLPNSTQEIVSKSKTIDTIVKTVRTSNSSRPPNKSTKIKNKKNTSKEIIPNKTNISNNIDKIKNIVPKIICVKNTIQPIVASNLIATPSIGSFPITSFIRMVPVQNSDTARPKISSTPITMINLQNIDMQSVQNNIRVSNESRVRLLHLQTPDGLTITSNQIPISLLQISNDSHRNENVPIYAPITNNLIEKNTESGTNIIPESSKNNIQSVKIRSENTGTFSLTNNFNSDLFQIQNISVRQVLEKNNSTN